MTSYSRFLNLTQVRQHFKEKLVDDGLEPDKAEAAANAMSNGGLEQVNKDLKRHPKIVIVNKLNGMTINVSCEIFNDETIVKYFIEMIACEDKELSEYFAQYLHQGGFLHLSELLIAYYFALDTRFETDNRVATFTLETNGEMSYEEKFDIKKVATKDGDFTPASDTPIATISLKSSFSKDANNEVKHQYHDMNVQVHDKVAGKFFTDPRGKFQKFLTWFKDTVNYIFNEMFRHEEKQRARVTPAIRKL